MFVAHNEIPPQEFVFVKSLWQKGFGASILADAGTEGPQESDKEGPSRREAIIPRILAERRCNYPACNTPGTPLVLTRRRSFDYMPKTVSE